MSDRSLYIDCYKVSDAKDLFKEWRDNVESKRNIIFQSLLDDTGAIAWRETSNWGKNYTTISDLVFTNDSIPEGDHIKHVDSSFYEGKRVTCVRGKMNRKAGKEFNKRIDLANESLKELLDFSDWIIDKFNIGRTGLGHSTGRGTAMISTSAGYYKGTMVITIPNDRCDGVSNAPAIPDSFESITYGQLHDIQHAE